MWDFISIRTVKAAKVHRCAECRSEIAQGEAHQYTAGKVEGEFESYRLCNPCAWLASAYCYDFDEEGFPLGEMRSVLRDEHGITDLGAWLADVDRRRAEAKAKSEARKARLSALDGVICGRCGATVATYVEACAADLDDRCPGFLTIEHARSGLADVSGGAAHG